MILMRFFWILILFLNLVGSLSGWEGFSPLSLNPSNPSTHELAQSDLSLQPSTILDVGEALPNSFVPERPVVRNVPHFFEAYSRLNIHSGLSAICRSMGRNYQKSAFTIDLGLPSFLIIFPHHYFT